MNCFTSSRVLTGNYCKILPLSSRLLLRLVQPQFVAFTRGVIPTVWSTLFISSSSHSHSSHLQALSLWSFDGYIALAWDPFRIGRRCLVWVWSFELDSIRVLDVTTEEGCWPLWIRPCRLAISDNTPWSDLPLYMVVLCLVFRPFLNSSVSVTIPWVSRFLLFNSERLPRTISRSGPSKSNSNPSVLCSGLVVGFGSGWSSWLEVLRRLDRSAPDSSSGVGPVLLLVFITKTQLTGISFLSITEHFY